MQRHYSLASVLAARHQSATAAQQQRQRQQQETNPYSALRQLTFGCTVVPPPVEAATEAFGAHIQRLLRIFASYDDQRKDNDIAGAPREQEICANSLLNITIASYSPYFSHTANEEEERKKNNQNNENDKTSLSATQYAAAHIPQWFVEHYQHKANNNDGEGEGDTYCLCTALAITGTRDTHCETAPEGSENSKNNNNAINSIRGATREGLFAVADHFVGLSNTHREKNNNNNNNNSSHKINLSNGFLCMRGEDRNYTFEKLLSSSLHSKDGNQAAIRNPYKDFRDGKDVLIALREHIAGKKKKKHEAQVKNDNNDNNDNNRINNVWDNVSLMCADYPQGYFIDLCEPKKERAAPLTCSFQQKEHVFEAPLQFFDFFQKQFTAIFSENHSGTLPSLEAYQTNKDDVQHKMSKGDIIKTAQQLLQRIELLFLFSDVITELTKRKHLSDAHCDENENNDLDLGPKIEEGAAVVITQAVPDWGTFLRYYNNVLQQQRHRPSVCAKEVFFSIGVMPPLPPFDYVRSLLQLKISVNEEEEEEGEGADAKHINNNLHINEEAKSASVRGALQAFYNQMQAALTKYDSSPSSADATGEAQQKQQETEAFLESVQAHERQFIAQIQLCIEHLLLQCAQHRASESDANVNNGTSLRLARHVSFFTFSYSSSIHLEPLFEKLAQLEHKEKKSK